MSRISRGWDRYLYPWGAPLLGRFAQFINTIRLSLMSGIEMLDPWPCGVYKYIHPGLLDIFSLHTCFFAWRTSRTDRPRSHDASSKDQGRDTMCRRWELRSYSRKAMYHSKSGRENAMLRVSRERVSVVHLELLVWFSSVGGTQQAQGVDVS